MTLALPPTRAVAIDLPDEARFQVVKALEQARLAWLEVRRQSQAVNEARAGQRRR